MGISQIQKSLQTVKYLFLRASGERGDQQSGPWAERRILSPPPSCAERFPSAGSGLPSARHFPASSLRPRFIPNGPGPRRSLRRCVMGNAEVPRAGKPTSAPATSAPAFPGKPADVRAARDAPKISRLEGRTEAERCPRQFGSAEATDRDEDRERAASHPAVCVHRSLH